MRKYVLRPRAHLTGMERRTTQGPFYYNETTAGPILLLSLLSRNRKGKKEDTFVVFHHTDTYFYLLSLALALSIHNFGPHRDFTRSLLSFLLLKNLPPPPPSPRDTLPLYCHIYGQVAYSSGTLRGRER